MLLLIDADLLVALLLKGLLVLPVIRKEIRKLKMDEHNCSVLTCRSEYCQDLFRIFHWRGEQCAPGGPALCHRPDLATIHYWSYSSVHSLTCRAMLWDSR